MDGVDIVARNLPALWNGAQLTLVFAAASVSLATIIGIMAGIISAVGWRLPKVAVLAIGYFIRGVPPLILLFLFYYGLPSYGLRAPPVVAAIVALSFYGAAFIAEIVRGGINSVPRAQVEGGKALGMEGWLLLRQVVLPQAVRYALPPYANMLSRLIRLTTIASVVNISELTLVGREIVQRDLHPFEVLGTTMLFYFIVTYPLTRLSVRVERRFAFRH